MLTQQTFLGASIVSFNGSLGWGSELSTLNVTLVEDSKNLDWFNPPDVGHPVFFNYSGWGFAGILQSWKLNKGESGFVYNVVCVDPREILEGYQIILGGYTATITTPNVANVYGHLESSGFGNSEKNETGIPWGKIKSSVLAICNTSTSYGGPISLRGHTYGIDLTALPNLNAKYRVGGDTISLMDFISEVCDAASHDFFITLQGTTIVVNTIDRSVAVAPGALTAYINGLTGVVSSEAGVEHRPETMGKVLLGGQQVNMYGQTKGGQRIWPFWGFEPNFDVKIGTGIDNAHEVELDSTSVRVPGVGATYKTNVKELRAVLDGQQSWEDFLISKNDEGTAATNIHFGKSDALSLIGFMHKKFKTEFPPSLNMTLTKTQIMKASEAAETDHEEAIGRLYDFLLGYARDFYGKQFLVSIPDVDAVIEPDTNKVRVSLEPVDAGFIDSADWNSAIANNLIPQDIVKLTNDDGRFPPYVRYDNIADLDFSDCPEDSIVYNDTQTSAFIKCTIKPGVAFEDVANVSSPRAVIVLPGMVRDRLINKLDNGGVLKDITDTQILNAGVTQEEKDRLLHAYGVDNIYSGIGGLAVIPDLVAIPLQDNTKVYGPWQKIGANGKMEVEQDPSLVPWNYGGYTELNIVGNAKVQDNVSFMQELETGSIEIPGIPTFTMGAQIVGGGPYVTDINVSIGEGGVTSTYQFSTWTQRFGKLRKANLARFTALTKKNIAIERKLKERKVSTQPLNNLQKQIRDIKKIKRQGGASSHGMLAGEGIPASGGGDGFYPNVFIQPHYNFTSQLGASGEAYRKKAGMSVDGMFRPYTTNVTESGLGMPYFQTAASGAESPHAQDLTPFKSGHDISVVIRGQDFPDDLSTHNDPYYGDDYRPIALKGPLVIAGWGYDTNNKPVPNESGGAGETRTDNFADGYLKDQSKWPVGPVYLPWDDDRKCWVGGGGTKAKIVQLVSDSSGGFPNGYNSAYNAVEVVPTWDGISVGSGIVSTAISGDPLLVGNFRRNIAVESGLYYALQINGKYYIDNQLTFFGGMI